MISHTQDGLFQATIQAPENADIGYVRYGALDLHQLFFFG